MPRPMYRSRSYRKLDRVARSGKHVIHYKRKVAKLPHCGICKKELNGISISKNVKGKSRRSNSRIFGGVLCAKCSSNVVKLASRIENGEMKLTDIKVKEKNYVMQMMAH